MSSWLLQQTLKAIRPPGTRAALGPGIVFVAVLKPDKIPEDDITVTDVFWAKIHVNKNVATLLAAYGKADARPVKLIQSSVAVKETQLISSLVANDGLCILEAVFESELALRVPEANRPQSVTPLQDITKNAVNQRSKPQGLGTKFMTPSTPMSPPAGSSNSAPAGLPRSSSLRSVSPSTAGVGVSSAEYWAWADFYFERSELDERQKDWNAISTRSSQRSTEKDIEEEWKRQAPWQQRYYFERVRSSRFLSPKNHRAFWMYYFDILEAQETKNEEWQASYVSEKMTDFHAMMLLHWKELGEQRLNNYYARLAHRSLTAPPLPSNASASTETSCPNTNQATPQASEAHDSTALPHGHTSESRKDAEVEEPVPQQLNISDLFDGKSIEQLEAGVEKGADIVNQLRAKLEVERSGESEHWLSLLSNLQKQINRTKTVIGVVGATGAGKSSVINAILDEERLVPTNCMRACTAVVTEISYNYSETPYRAEIDFISKEDWLKELKTSFHDLFDGSGKVSRECTNEESEAGIAYAKIRAVYPSMSKDMMENTTIEELMNHSNVRNLLGGNRSIEHDNSLIFYKKLQQYVDSKEKVFSKEKRTAFEKPSDREMEYWPLIRVVRLYVKASALATGAVLVDLPGVHDSNQARAAVAQGYLKQCTGLWIVAPITRAVDDKSAKTLLGDSFKRQLKMDGGYNSVTFICSKTDDISLTEAQDSLGLDNEVEPLYARGDELRKKNRDLNNQLNELKATRSDISAATDSADEILEVWEKLASDLEEGKTVYAPKEKGSKKRERDDDDAEPRKKSKYTEDSDDDFIDDDYGSDFAHSDVDSAYGGTPGDSDHGQPLTEEGIADKISELKATKKEARREKSQLEQKMKDIRAQIAEVSKEQDEIDGDLTGRCIRGRNEYSRGAIQQDFAAGIRELDQEIAEEEDAANFNPEEDIRDYDVVADSLPVFCVSSRGYQKLKGRLQKDKGLPCFRNVDETEVPALQKHCETLTVNNREIVSKRFLNSLGQLLNSMRLWSSSNSSGPKLSSDQLQKEAEILKSRLDKLDTEIENAVTSTCSSVQSEIQEHVQERFPTSVDAARKEAGNIQAKWGAPVNRQNRPEGGLYWATYKATVRRDGTYSGNHFNDDLIEPLIKQVTPGWERAFQRLIPKALSGFPNDIYQLLLTFHNEVEKRALINGSNIAAFQILRHQLPTYKETSKDASNLVKEFINTQQKDLNRAFVGTISEAMLPAYATTTAESGPGSYMRMKNAMRDHVEHVKATMFDNSVQHVQQLIRTMMKDAEDMLASKVDEVFLAAKRDYESVVVGQSNTTQKDVRLPPEQRRARKEILAIVDSVESDMKQVLEPEPAVAIDDEDGSLEDGLEAGATSRSTKKQTNEFEFDCDLDSDDPSGIVAHDGDKNAQSPTEEQNFQMEIDESSNIAEPVIKVENSENNEKSSILLHEINDDEPVTTKAPQSPKISQTEDKENAGMDTPMIKDQSGASFSADSAKWKTQKSTQGQGEQWWASSTSDTDAEDDGEAYY